MDIITTRMMDTTIPFSVQSLFDSLWMPVCFRGRRAGHAEVKEMGRRRRMKRSEEIDGLTVD